MAHINDAFRFIIPKYRYHSNQAMMVIDNRWQAQDHIEPRLPPCNSMKYPASGNQSGGRDVVQDYTLLSQTARSPSAVLNDWTGLPAVPLPYMPPANLGLTRNGSVKAPMFWNESPVIAGCDSKWNQKCSTMDTCDSMCEKLARGTSNYMSFKPHEPGMW